MVLIINQSSRRQRGEEGSRTWTRTWSYSAAPLKFVASLDVRNIKALLHKSNVVNHQRDSGRIAISPSVAQAKSRLITEVDHLPAIRGRGFKVAVPNYTPICTPVMSCCLSVVQACAPIGVGGRGLQRVAIEVLQYKSKSAQAKELMLKVRCLIRARSFQSGRGRPRILKGSRESGPMRFSTGGAEELGLLQFPGVREAPVRRKGAKCEPCLSPSDRRSRPAELLKR